LLDGLVHHLEIRHLKRLSRCTGRLIVRTVVS
jgi:hypothetical protein